MEGMSRLRCFRSLWAILARFGGVYVALPANPRGSAIIIAQDKSGLSDELPDQPVRVREEVMLLDGADDSFGIICDPVECHLVAGRIRLQKCVGGTEIAARIAHAPNLDEVHVADVPVLGRVAVADEDQVIFSA